MHAVDDIADPNRWTVTLEDDSGRALAPTARIHARRARLSLEFRHTSHEFAPPPPHVQKILPPATAYQGDAVYRFDAIGLGVPVRSRELRLRIRRPDGVTLRYDWFFRDGPVQVAHHGWTDGATGIGALVVPGETTRIAASELLRWLLTPRVHETPTACLACVGTAGVVTQPTGVYSIVLHTIYS